MIRRPPRSTLFPTRRSSDLVGDHQLAVGRLEIKGFALAGDRRQACRCSWWLRRGQGIDRKSTRLNSSHGYISYAVFCLKKKNNNLLSHTLTVERSCSFA